MATLILQKQFQHSFTIMCIS
nr:unnamed protein product [Callosobruchus analis]